MPRCTARSPWPLCLSETGSLVDDGDEEAQWRDDDDGDDDEEEEDDGVESVVAYLPQLLEVKYGKDWESLMGASPDDEDEEEEGGMDDRWDFTNEEEGSIKEEELRWLVMQQMKRDEEEGVVPGDEPAAATGRLGEEASYQAAAEEEEEEEQEQEEPEEPAAEGVTLPEGIALDPSPLLATFAKQLQEGRALPEPFPESEWLQIFTCAVRDEARFLELEGTWANLRVLLACNFDDLECDEAALQGTPS